MLFYLSIILGIILLYFGGDFLVRGSNGLARKLKISPMIIGIVIIGFGTSVPEIFVTTSAVTNNSPDILSVFPSSRARKLFSDIFSGFPSSRASEINLCDC